MHLQVLLPNLIVMENSEHRLILKVNSHQNQTLGELSEKEFMQGGGSFGRSEENDWVLPDTTRTISSKHGEVFFDSGTFCLRDTSTNGIYMAGHIQPIGRGNSVVLNHGDTFTFSDYSVEVSIQAQTVSAHTTPARINLADDDFLSDIADSGENPFLADLGGNSTLSSQPAYIASEEDNAVGWSLPESGTNLEDVGFDPLAPETLTDKPEAIPDENFLQGGHLLQDEIRDKQADSVNADSISPGNNTFLTEAYVARDLESDPFNIVNPMIPEIQPDQAAGGMETAETPGMIPEDWDVTSFGNRSKPAVPLTEKNQLGKPKQKQSGFEKAEVKQTVAPVAGARKIKPSPGQSSVGNRKASTVIERKRPVRQGAAVPPNKVSTSNNASGQIHKSRADKLGVDTPSQNRASPASRSAGSVSEDLSFLHSLMAELGLQPGALSEAQEQKLSNDFAHMFQIILQGLMDIMRARSELKNQFRMSQTIVQSAENNPLKILPRASDALKILLSQESTAYLGTVEAVEEAVSDIRNHQLAMVTAMRSAFNDLAERLHPENFQEQAQETNLAKAALNSINSKSRAWNAYEEFYQQNVLQSGNAFQLLFGEAFGEAYQQQVQRMSKIKQHNRPSRDAEPAI